MRKTIKNVTIVVPVLIASCQVSLKSKSGPLMAQTSMTSTAIAKLPAWPQIRAVRLAALWNANRHLAVLGTLRLSSSFDTVTILELLAPRHDQESAQLPPYK